MKAAARAQHGLSSRLGENPALLIRSPGRVNLIGDHTDYSEGFVLPIAIDRAVWMALRPRTDTVVRVWAELPDATVEFDVADLQQRPGWHAYMEGVAAMLLDAGHELRGFDAAVTTDLPTGAGLSSSAALELATARAFAEVSGIPWSPVEMAVLCQRAENEWVGMNCGIMDQLICATGRAEHAMLIDCRSLDTTPTHIPREASVLVLDTTTRRRLVDSAYNERRLACESAAAALGVSTLRDLNASELEAGRDRVDEVVFRRARHVVTENRITCEAQAALDGGDLAHAGELMRQSHASLRDDYEVTTPELDAMAEIAWTTAGCFGARMTGAGFGGSVVALTAAGAADQVAAAVLAAYRTATGYEGSALQVAASEGVAPSEPA